jgi:hypothetical protein
MDEQAGRQWFKQEGDHFVIAFQCPENLRSAFETLTAELVDYRLAHYAKTRIEKAAELKAGRFIAKVSHSNGKPILRLPTVEELPGRPVGPTPPRFPMAASGCSNSSRSPATWLLLSAARKTNFCPCFGTGLVKTPEPQAPTTRSPSASRNRVGQSSPLRSASHCRFVPPPAETVESDDEDELDLPGFVESPAAKDKLHPPCPRLQPRSRRRPLGTGKHAPRKSAGPRRREPPSNPACSSPASVAIRWSQESRTAPGTSSAPAPKAPARAASSSSSSTPWATRERRPLHREKISLQQNRHRRRLATQPH